jgi:hypothetical protein
MSGGSYNYAYSHMRGFCDELRERLNGDPRRERFLELVERVAEAMRKVEWVDSGDCGPGDEHAHIDACFALLGSDK